MDLKNLMAPLDSCGYEFDGRIEHYCCLCGGRQVELSLLVSREVGLVYSHKCRSCPEVPFVQTGKHCKGGRRVHVLHKNFSIEAKRMYVFFNYILLIFLMLVEKDKRTSVYYFVNFVYEIEKLLGGIRYESFEGRELVGRCLMRMRHWVFDYTSRVNRRRDGVISIIESEKILRGTSMEFKDMRGELEMDVINPLINVIDYVLARLEIESKREESREKRFLKDLESEMRRYVGKRKRVPEVKDEKKKE